MPTLREQIALKRAEARSSPARPGSRPGTPARAATPLRANSPFGGSNYGGGGFAGAGAGDDLLEDKNVSGQISKARRTGKLDLALLELRQLPHELYIDLLGLPVDELSNPPPAPKKDESVRTPGKPGKGAMEDSFSRLGFGGDESDEDSRSIVFNQPRPQGKWVEPEELTAFKANGNMLKEIDLEVGLFGGLKNLDLHGNELSRLPNALADLLQLTRIDLSQNAFTDIPAALQLLPVLESINLSENAVATIDLSAPVKPSEEGMSYGTGFLVSAFERARNQPKHAFPALRVLNLAHNALTCGAVAGLGGAEPLKLRVLTLSHNQLEGELDAAAVGAQRMPELQSLVLAHNRALDAVDGELAPGCQVDMEGCCCGAVGAAAPGGSLARSTSEPAPAPAEDAYVPAAGGPSDVPEPDATLTFVTHPAATFDGEPLPVTMDVYLPPSDAAVPAKGFPVVVWWHGGGLLQGNKENLPPHLRRLPRRPLGEAREHCVVVSPNYRLAPQAPILDVLADVDAAVSYVRTKLNARLEALGRPARVDAARVVLSGGSAGGYLALMAGLPVPARASDADVGGYRGAGAASGAGAGAAPATPSRYGAGAAAQAAWAPRGIAAFYPITDLCHEFWATRTDPVPWWGSSVPEAAAEPHLNPRDAPVAAAVSGGPRSILYPYMLQHALFPRLLFMNQRSRGHGLDGYRPSPETMSVTHRLRLEGAPPRPPVYVVYGTKDDKIQPLADSVDVLRQTGDTDVLVIPGADHAYDEDPNEQAEGFVAWLEKVI